jgi:hypothetical protein
MKQLPGHTINNLPDGSSDGTNGVGGEPDDGGQPNDNDDDDIDNDNDNDVATPICTAAKLLLSVSPIVPPIMQDAHCCHNTDFPLVGVFVLNFISVRI